jgi:hypothetical protein
MKKAATFLLVAATPLVACHGGVKSEGPDEVYFSVAGTVVDFETGEPLDQATVSTSGIKPSPAVTIDGAEYFLGGVPLESTFNLLVGSPPDYRDTYASAITVIDESLEDVVVAAVSDGYLADLGAGFGIEAAGLSAVLVQATDAAGAPRAGVPAAAFVASGAGSGPFFLDAELHAAPALTETSESGWVVFFDLEPGLVEVVAPEASGYAVEMPRSPTSDGMVTLAAAVVRDPEEAEDDAARPTDVSFETDVKPIFLRRRCDACHSGNGVGKQLGGLQLDGGSDKVYKELTVETPTNLGSRVDLADPAASLILTMPSAEDPADDHPNITFASDRDPDYVTLLVWIEEGAKL